MKTIPAFAGMTLLLSIGVAFSGSGCGYTFSRLLPSEYRTICVEPFENAIPITQESSERAGAISNFPGIEERVTQAVISRFLFDGNLRVTTRPEDADLMLSGKLLDFYRQALRRLDDSTVEEYRLNLSSSMTLRDRKGRILLENKGFVGDTTYFVTGGQARSESAAVDELVTDFSKRVVEWVIEYW